MIGIVSAEFALMVRLKVLLGSLTKRLMLSIGSPFITNNLPSISGLLPTRSSSQQNRHVFNQDLPPQMIVAMMGPNWLDS